MPCEMLVVAIVKPPYIRGEPVVVKDQPASWGSREGLPNWVRVIISNKTAEEVTTFLEPLQSVFTYTVLSANGNGKRIRVEINPAIVTEFGADAGMREELYVWLQSNYNAQNVPAQSNPPYDYVLDFPDPDLNLQELKLAFEDEAVNTLAPHRYHFSDADVDTAVANGGEVTLTGAQAASRIIDRLA